MNADIRKSGDICRIADHGDIGDEEVAGAYRMLKIFYKGENVEKTADYNYWNIQLFKKDGERKKKQGDKQKIKNYHRWTTKYEGQRIIEALGAVYFS